jgi:hypothetical protein
VTDRDARADGLELELPQLDFDGAVHAPAPEPPAYQQDRGRSEQPRLFQPQLEGQLELE